KILIEVLGNSGTPDYPSDNYFIHPYETYLDRDTKVVAYQVWLTDNNLLILKKQLNELGIVFDKRFVRDYRHLHIPIYADDGTDIGEGIAYGKKDDSWDVYYIEGELEKHLGITTGEEYQEYFVFNVPNNEINTLEDIEHKFKKWVSEQKEKMG
ncbi:hypothetical protein M1N64_04920, partial [Peptococcaceae bacterium]|nr:hypothetical protein [Peptococcaceae bacterium]